MSDKYKVRTGNYSYEWPSLNTSCTIINKQGVQGLWFSTAEELLTLSCSSSECRKLCRCLVAALSFKMICIYYLEEIFCTAHNVKCVVYEKVFFQKLRILQRVYKLYKMCIRNLMTQDKWSIHTQSDICFYKHAHLDYRTMHVYFNDKQICPDLAYFYGKNSCQLRHAIQLTESSIKFSHLLTSTISMKRRIVTQSTQHQTHRMTISGA